MRRRGVRTERVALASALAGLAVACGGPAPESSPNVLLVVIDTLRADRVGVYGNERGLTPFLDEQAERGITFANAYAASSWTVPSVASLFTSRFPSQHRMLEFESRLGEAELTLAERLDAAGFLTAGFTANFRLGERFGYAQGFDHWSSYLPGKTDAYVSGDTLLRHIEVWLDETWSRDDPRPVLLYVHYMEPHPPFLPPDPLRRRHSQVSARRARALNDKLLDLSDLWGKTLDAGEMEVLRDLYDGEVAAADRQVRALFDALSERGFLDHAVVAITSDHGEEFKEHGAVLHGFNLYNATIRVPLLLRLPGGPAGAVVEAPVSLVDVTPTLLDALGIPPDPLLEGRSLLPLVRGESGSRGEDPGLLTELVADEKTAVVRKHEAALIRDSAKLLVGRDGELEVYDLDRDPGETSPNPSHLAEERQELRSSLAERRAELSARASTDSGTVPLDEETRQRLRDLGYAVE